MNKHINIFTSILNNARFPNFADKALSGAALLLSILTISSHFRPITQTMAQSATPSATQQQQATPTPWQPTPTPTSATALSPTATPNPSPTGITRNAPTPTTTLTPTPTISVPTPSGFPVLIPGGNPTASPSTGISLMPTNTSAASATLKQVFGPRFSLRPLPKKNYSFNESIVLRVLNGKDINLKATLKHASGETINVPFERTVVGEEVLLRIAPQASFRPGRYTVTVSDPAGGKLEKNFTWGVLALNTNKSIYLPGETVKFSMAVLDELGRMVCSAKLTLLITTPSDKKDILSTTERSIKIHQECQSHRFTLNPDYSASYDVSEVGIYRLKLTSETPTDTFSIEDAFEVRETVPFDIERTSATRIYPPSTYPMKFNIIANQDFQGTIRETVPESFVIYALTEDNYLAYDRIETESPANVLGASTSTIIPQLTKPFLGQFSQTQGFGEIPDSPFLQMRYHLFGVVAHDGIDFALPSDTPVLAADAGKVILAGRGSYGQTVIIKHSWGQSFYGHLKKITVSVGQQVKAGDQVGLSGQTGLATGPHLHFGIQPNQADVNNGYLGKIDPGPFLGMGTTSSLAKVKTIIWKVSLIKGQQLNLGYRYKIPDNSPEFYLLGPLALHENTRKGKLNNANALVDSIDAIPGSRRLTSNPATPSAEPSTATSSSPEATLSARSSATSTIITTSTASAAKRQPLSVDSLSPSRDLVFQEQRSWQLAADSPGPGIEQQVNIIDREVSALGGTGSTGLIHINTSDFTGGTYYFEVIAKVDSGSGTVTLTYGAGDGATPTGGSTTQITGITATSYTRYRSGSFALSTGNAYLSAMTGTGIKLNAARIIIVQTSASSITDTQTQVEIGNNESSTNTSLTALSGAKYFKFDASKYDGTVTAYLEVTMAASSGTTATADLYNLTDSASVGNSTVSVASTTYNRLRSSALTTNWDTTNADQYAVRVKTSNANGPAHIVNAKIILDQTNASGITKLETYHSYFNTFHDTLTYDVGAFSTTSQGQLPQRLKWFTSVTTAIGGTNYVYVLGGYSTTYQSTVYKATINSSDDIGSFATTSQGQLPHRLRELTSVTTAIGGTNYIYVLGGYNAFFSTQSTVYKATVDASGNIGSFATTSQGQLPQRLYQHTNVATTIGGTNYVYVLGGNRVGSAYQSTVYKATVDASGNIGSFATTSQGQLPQLLAYHASVIAYISGTNYVYVLGGYNVSYLSTVYKATIDSSGDIGSFATTNQGQLPQLLYDHTSVIASIGGTNYVYILGGYTGSYLSTVYKATIDSSGDIGSFATTNQGQLPQLFRLHTSVTTAIGGTNYIYVLGGEKVTYLSTVYKATLGVRDLSAGGGDIGSFATTNQGQLPQNLTDHSSITASIGGTNYVYVLGGSSASGSYHSTVYKTTIDSSGNIGSFSTTSQGQLPQKLQYHSTVTASIGDTNYVYVIGGYLYGAFSTVYKATINASGNIGSFSTTSQGQLPQILSNHSSITVSIGGTSYIYVLGGNNDVTWQSIVYKATIDASGNIGSFSTSNQGQLPQLLGTLYGSATASIGGTNYVYVLGGWNGSYYSTVYKATIDASGNIGSFSTSNQGQLPQLLRNNPSVTTSIGGTNYIYVLGGRNTVYYSTVYKAPIDSSGNIGSFDTTSQGQLPQILDRNPAITASIGGTDYIYVLGGYSSTYQSTVYKAQISNNNLSFNYDNRYSSSDWTGGTFTYYHEGTIKGVTSSTGQAYLDPGNLGQITTGYVATDIGSFATTSQGQLPQTFIDHTSVTASVNGTNYVYTLGGTDYNATYYSTVYKATVDSSGNVGSFSTTNQNQLFDRLVSHTSITVSIGGTNYLYVLGGYSATSGQSIVYKATIDSSGNIGSFSTTNQGQLPLDLYDHTSATASIGGTNYLYVLGGTDYNFGNNKSTVYKATIDASGDIGSFSTSSQGQLPQILDGHTSVTTSIGGTNYVYVLGGYNSVYQSTVYKATIDSSGNIGSFSTSSQGQLPQKLRGLTSATASIGGTNYVYVLGGYDGGAAADQSTVYKATIDASGNIGSFSTSSQGQLPQILDSHTSVTTSIGGTNYIYVLGGNNGSAYQSTVYKATFEGSTPSLSFSLVRSSAITPTDATDYDAIIQTAGLSTSWLVINVTGLEAVSGPTLDQLLRHGEWFNSSGVRQPFTF